MGLTIQARVNCKIVTIIDTLKKKLIIFILLKPAVQRAISSFSASNFSIVIIIDIKKDNGINLVKILTKLKEEYFKYNRTECPSSTIKSRKFTD